LSLQADVPVVKFVYAVVALLRSRFPKCPAALWQVAQVDEMMG
jgi:hypothetical protein